MNLRNIEESTWFRYVPVYKLAQGYDGDDRPATLALWLARPYRVWHDLNIAHATVFDEDRL